MFIGFLIHSERGEKVKRLTGALMFVIVFSWIFLSLVDIEGVGYFEALKVIAGGIGLALWIIIAIYLLTSQSN